MRVRSATGAASRLERDRSPAHDRWVLDRAERRLAAASSAAGLAIGLLSSHRGLYNDGVFFVQWLSDWPLLPGEKHVWLYPHLLYLPLARAFHAIVQLFADVRIDASLRAFSAVGLAAAAPCLVRFHSAFMGAPSNALATLLALFAPSVWFFAGATEIHTLHLAAAAAALAAAARPPRRFARASFVAGVLLLEATHLTGFLLLPAMLLLRERARRNGLTDDRAGWLALAATSAAAMALLAAAAVALHLAFESHSVLHDYFASVHPAEQGYVETILKELVVQSGVLVPGALLAAVFLARREAMLAASVGLTFVLYAHMIGKSQVEYHGGYNVAAIPIWGAALGCALDRVKAPWGVFCGAVCLAAQVALGAAPVAEARTHDRAAETADEVRAFWSPGDALLLRVRPGEVDFDLTQLPNLTRLYFGLDLPNAALLDDTNANGVPYLTEGEAEAAAARAEASVEAALHSGRRAFAAAGVLEPDAAAPRLGALAESLRRRFAVKPVPWSARWFELTLP